MRQLALGFESKWVKSTHDAYENSCKCGELKIYFSPSAWGWRKIRKVSVQKVQPLPWDDSHLFNNTTQSAIFTMVGSASVKGPCHSELIRPERATCSYRSARDATRRLFVKIKLQRATEAAPAETVYRSCYRRFRYRIRSSFRIKWGALDVVGWTQAGLASKATIVRPLIAW